MLYRKIAREIEAHLRSGSEKILVIDGARQVGKTYIVREVGRRLFKNFIEINMVEEAMNSDSALFSQVRTVADFYLRLNMVAGDRMGTREDTLVFIDEIQEHPRLLTLLKFLARDGRFTYIASASMLGVALAETISMPMGSIRRLRMYPLDFEEFLYANGVNAAAVDALYAKFERRESLDAPMHARIMDLFRNFLLIGGMPAAVNEFLQSQNLFMVRQIQSDLYLGYGIDASKYDKERKLKIRRIYDLIPSCMENKKKRIRANKIEGKDGKTFSDYDTEFEYIVNAGIALQVLAVSNPRFSLRESAAKNLRKLYLNDVGILTGILYQTNAQAILKDTLSVNLGAIYETAVACELAAHGHEFYYFDRKNVGEVDYLINDYSTCSVVPIEVKSGKDYTVHSALDAITTNPGYAIDHAFVLSNEREITCRGKIHYIPVYFTMFL